MERKDVPGFGALALRPPSKPPEPKPPSLSLWSKHPSVRKCSVNEQKGIYSDNEIQFRKAEPEAQQRSPGQSTNERSVRNTTKATTFETPPDQCKLVEKDKHGDKSQQSQTSYFCRGGDMPKVQIPYKTAAGQIPRKLAIERRRREYLAIDFEQLLAEKGINSNLLMPRHRSSTDESATTSDSPVSPYLPLEVFDNEEYDCRTPEDWLALGSAEQKPICAKALLPTDGTLPSEDQKISSLNYSWHLVGVLDYSEEKCQYLVQKVHQESKLTDEKGNPILEKKSRSLGVNIMHGGSKFWVPRIRLLFTAEDPRVFVERIQFALRWRENTEALLLYHLSVDYMPIWKGTPSLDTYSLQRIEKYAFSTPGLRQEIVQKCRVDLEKEIKLEYGRTMNRMIFDKVVMSHPEKFSYITLPQKEPEFVPQTGCVPLPLFAFQKKKAAFVSRSLLTEPLVVCVLSEIWPECSKVAAMRLFNVTSVKPLRLDQFEIRQSEVHTEISLFLREAWIVTLSNSIRSNLDTKGKGWYNVNESRWDIYKISKLYRLMSVVRLNQQDSLRFLVQESLLSLTQLLLNACHSVLTCPQDLVWGDDLITSPYKPKENPLFLVELVLDQTGVHYSPPLENFETSMVNLFDNAIQATYNVPQLDKFVMQKLYIGADPLQSVSLWEPEVTELREKIRNALIQAAIPLRAYAAEYEKHLELHNLDIETFVKSHTHAEQTSQEVKKEVEQHLEEKERIEHSLPSSIVIGPFSVRVEAVRQALSNKRKALANAMLNHLVRKLRKQVDDACEECNTLSKKLREKPNTIEELTEKRDWMKQIPEQLRTYKEVMGKILLDYELVEEHHYSLPDNDFNTKWRAIGWPQRIISQVEEVAVQNKKDEEHFHKIHLADQDKLGEQLNSLQMLVAGFAAHTDVRHAHELANEVKRTSKQLEECQRAAQTYNARELLFGIPVTNDERLQKLVQDLQPYKDLWITASDWLNWHDSWLNGPLSSIDPEQLERNVTDAHQTMIKCIEHFKDIPDCQTVVTFFHSKIEIFQPSIPLIQGLGNPGMRIRHWEMLSERIQMDVKPKANWTFSRCLELGLQKHMDDITHVAEVAGKEYAIEQALEKMEQKWSTVLFDMMPYKETDTFTLKSPDEASKLLNNHIAMTQSMSLSPFKKAFEDHINTWESKLRLTQDVLEEWLKCQHSWLHLQPIFSSDDINQQLPEDAKRYQKADKKWRSVMKRAFDNRKVIELCPDANLLDILKTCNILLEQVQKSLSEHSETK